MEKRANELTTHVLTGITQAPKPPTSEPSPADVASVWTQGFRTFDDPKLVALLGHVDDFRRLILAGEAPRWLTLLGASGAGKTHLTRALWKEVRRRCDWNPSRCAYTPAFTHWPNFVDKLRSGEWYPFLDDMKRWPFLFLDDIGAERDPTGFAADRLSTLLACRVGRWTAITGNLGVADIEAMDVRIASRMRRGGSVVVEVTAMDYALRTAPRRAFHGEQS